MKWLGWLVAAALCALAIPDRVRADQPLEARSLGNVKLRIDGDLRDWRGARFASLGEEDTGSMQYALGYDADALYVGARVNDDDVVRSAEASAEEDAVVLTLALPQPDGRFIAHEVWLYPGIAGKQAALGALRSGRAKPVAQAAIQAVEGPLPSGKGYVLEARVPWSALPDGREFMIARAVIGLNDADGSAHRTHVLASASGGARALPPLLISGGPNSAIVDFLHAKQLATANVRYDLAGDVADDERLERVVVAGTFAVWAGPQVQGSNGFHYADLPVSTAAGVADAALRDLTGDGKAELMVRLRVDDDHGTRELFRVFDLSAGRPNPLFTLVVREQTDAYAIASELRVGAARAGKPVPIEVRIGEARGVDADGYAPRGDPGIEPLLTPWGASARRTYAWDGQRFAVSEEQPNPAAHAARAVSSAPARSAAPATVEHAAPPGAAELIAAFREARGIDPSIKPRFTQHANFAEDRAIESLLFFGKDVLLIGKGYRGGTGYFYYSLPVRDGADIQRVFTGDVTGDGRRELFVRVKQMVGDVQREILLGYTFTDDGIAPILAREVRRAQGDASIGNVVALVREQARWALRISAGRAQGWDARSYPFVAEATDAYAPLLLPWRGDAQRYRWDGSQLAIAE
jgi:hypothetical protein